MGGTVLTPVQLHCQISTGPTLLSISDEIEYNREIRRLVVILGKMRQPKQKHSIFRLRIQRKITFCADYHSCVHLALRKAASKTLGIRLSLPKNSNYSLNATGDSKLSVAHVYL